MTPRDARAERETRSQVLHGEDLCYRTSRLQRRHYQAVRTTADGVRQAEAQGRDKLGTYPTFLRETFADLYSGGRLSKVEPSTGDPAAATVSKLHQLRSQVPEMERLAARCRGDNFNATLATTAVAQGLVDQVPEHTKDVQKARQSLQALQALQADGQDLPQDLMDQAQAEVQAAEMEATMAAEGLDEGSIRVALRQAVDQAADQIEAMDTALQVMGWGTGAGTPSDGEAAETKAQVAKALQDAPKLRDLFELAGRMRLIARRVQAEKVRHGAGELANVETGADVARMLPSEAMMMVDSDLEALWLKSYAERGLLQYQLQDKDPAGKGPVVVLVDDSGSMGGRPECWAKALAVALMDLARDQGRSFALGTFSSSMGVKIVETDADRLDIPATLRALTPFIGGGTNWSAPLAWGLEVIEGERDLREADVILITDGLARLSPQEAQVVRDRAKALDANILGIVVENPRGDSPGQAGEPSGPIANALGAFCDQVHTLAGLVSEDGQDTKGRPRDGQVLHAALSI